MSGGPKALLMAVVLAGAAASGVGLWFINTPASSSPEEVVVDVPKGAGLRNVAALLEKDGVIGSARLFTLYARLTGKTGATRAGEFRFRRNLTPHQVLEILVKGEVVLHKLTVPEGLTAKDIAALVGADGIGDPDEFSKLVDDAEFVHSLGLPANRLEGYLFPDTYEFARGAGARKVAEEMVRRFKVAWTPEIAAATLANGLSEHQAVTLASIVEKETGDPTERPIIAGVFYNRLKKKMRLDSDPTIIYGMKDYDGDIRKKDIHDPSNLYNTYVIKGLPPGPIASPGAEALHAVAYPGLHSYLYFVACGEERKHLFSASYAEHDKNVDRCQRHRHG